MQNSSNNLETQSMLELLFSYSISSFNKIQLKNISHIIISYLRLKIANEIGKTNFLHVNYFYNLTNHLNYIFMNCDATAGGV